MNTTAIEKAQAVEIARLKAALCSLYRELDGELTPQLGEIVNGIFGDAEILEECDFCGALVPEDEITSVQTQAQTHEDPAEYGNSCEKCARGDN